MRIGELFSERYWYQNCDEKAVEILVNSVGKEIDSGTNRVLELYNAYHYIEKNKARLPFEKSQTNGYLSLIAGAKKRVACFFNSLNEENIFQAFSECDTMFWDDFHNLFFRFKVYCRISKESIIDVIRHLMMTPMEILKDKCFVQEYNEEITQLFEDQDYSAEFIIEYYMGLRDERTAEKCYWPGAMTKEKKYSIVERYIEGDRVSPNTLALIFDGRSRCCKEFEPDDDLRYIAKTRYLRFWKEDKRVIQGIPYEGNIEFRPCKEGVHIDETEFGISAYYDSDWIKENLDYPTILNNFIYLFGYVDSCMRCTLTAEHNERSFLERFYAVNGNGMYLIGDSFRKKDRFSIGQMACYLQELNRYEVCLEEVIKWFFESYLVEEFSAVGFHCMMPEKTDSILNKFTRTAAVLDGIVKQFNLFCKNGKIDRGRYEYSSSTPTYGEIRSLIKSKYAYAKSEEIKREMRDMFSTQSPMVHLKGRHNRIQPFYSAILNNSITTDELLESNLQEFDWLVSRGTIFVENGRIQLNMERTIILGDLYTNRVICLQYLNSQQVKAMLLNGDIEVDNHLLTIYESRYFNYVLNDREFSNSIGLRNRYMHESYPLDNNMQYEDYLILLRMLIILVIKINEDFCLRQKANSLGDFYETKGYESCKNNEKE